MDRNLNVLAQNRTIPTKDKLSPADVEGMYQLGKGGVESMTSPQEMVNAPRTIEAVPQGNQINPLSQRGRINAADNMSEEFFLKELMNPKANPQMVSILRNALQNRANKLRPLQKTVMERDPSKTYIERDTEGKENVLQTGKEKPKPFDVEGSYKNKDTKTYWSYDKQKGIYFDTKIPYDKNEDGTSGTSGSGEGKGYNYSNLYANVQTGIKKIKELKETKLSKQLNKELMETGKFEFTEPGTNKIHVFNKSEDFHKYKETIKESYVNDAIERSEE